MKNFFRSMKDYAVAFPKVLLFELSYKLILIAIGAPIIMVLLRITAKVSGVGYVSDESLLVYLHDPLTLIVFIIVLFCVGFFTFVELSSLAACFSFYSLHQRISVGDMLRIGLKCFAKAFRSSGILKFLGFMVCMPLAEFTLSSGIFYAPLLPILRRVFDGIHGGIAVIAYVLLQLVFIFIIVSRSYSLHYLVLTDKKFPECVRLSREKIHRKKLRTAFSFFLWTLFILAVIVTAVFGVSFLVILVIKGSRPDSAFRSALYVLRYAMNVFTAVSAFFVAPAIMCWLTGRFFGDLAPDEELVLPQKNGGKTEKAHRSVVIVSLIAAALLLNTGYLRALYKGNISLNTGVLMRTQISAHRGYSSVAPENTVYAFEAALDSGADYIELDVQLTADGLPVVFHDETLERTTDGKGRLKNFTYDQLQTLSAGSWFSSSQEFDDAKIMLLSDVFELVGRKKLLNIEIKNIGDVHLTAEKVVELIDEYNITSSCYVTSFSGAALKAVKELDSRIKTALIVNIDAPARYTSLSYVDAVSMNYIFVNQNVVSNAHRNGKKIFVWTVDRREDMEKMVALGVDNIITDRPDLAAETIYSDSVGETILKLLDVLFN